MRERWVALSTLAMLQIVTIVAGSYALTHEDFTLSAMTRQTPPPVVPAESPSAPVFTSGPVLARGGDGPLPPKTTLARELTDALGDRALGGRVGAVVLDAATGQRLFAKNPDVGITPASTTKIVTGAAALASLGPDARLATRVLQGGTPDAVVLVGGGDPTLAGPAAKKDGPYPRQASLAQLAQRTAAALKARGVTKVTLSYDDSLFTGPSKGPGWKPSYIPDGNVAPVTALMIDSGRLNPAQSIPRVSDPSRHAATVFARLLSRYGVAAGKTVRRATASPGAAELARVESAPVYALVERALTLSDNDLSEALARHVALHEGEPGSFEGAARAVQKVMKRLGVAQGVQVYDGSGLSTMNRISADALARLVSLAAAPGRPELHGVVSGMPIAGFTGTLGNGRRFTGSDSKSGVGLVRAKTGTLNHVNTLAGLATTSDGRLVTFAFMADRVPYTAEPVLDRLAAIVARA
ncbi:D-alanyl-D-alanine carboxypeptidase/D-alanyl-D-alanine-endopeptidase [Thermoactinospora rubra]|uniref:D-alanyl-D-alanine carboxypeptidase/D-alanyl-D-alanine endopeptidase n=1 Tax=Thermoactinospora rubra TaxID=1088767 RepID=UPI000A122009|nr:D-alanyl-D-alanine carboxypeptidase/D-alanyl-D-alanine-endopeptidase [Thermoactinospora rubra]